MELNTTLVKIKQLLNERNWSMYRLAKEADIPYSSLNALFQKNNQPTLSTLEKICAGFNISMFEFFSDYPPYRQDTSNLEKDELELLNIYRKLNHSNQKSLLQIAEILLKNK